MIYLFAAFSTREYNITNVGKRLLSLPKIYIYTYGTRITIYIYISKQYVDTIEMYITQLFNNVNNGNNRNIRGNKQRNNIYIYIYIHATESYTPNNI